MITPIKEKAREELRAVRRANRTLERERAKLNNEEKKIVVYYYYLKLLI
jgi:hypothetical protein